MNNRRIGALALLAFVLMALVGANYLAMANTVKSMEAQALELKTIARFLQENRPSQTGATASQGQAAGGVDEAALAKIVEQVIPKGTPAGYGEELKVSFDSPVEGMNTLAKLDGDLFDDGKLKFSDLGAAEQARYIKIGNMIACEYCCGAKSLVLPNGKPACGCAHSAAMRGLAKYLLKNNAAEYTDEQIVGELAKWKAMFFPKQTIEKAMQLQAQGQGVNPGALNQLPDMVGGC